MPHDVSPDSGDFGLIARFLNGDEAAFETLFRNYQHRFLALSRRFLDDQAEAEDVVQEAFVDIYHGLRRFNRRSSFQTWAYRIVVRKCGERRRKQAQRQIAPTPLDTMRDLPAVETLPGVEDMLVRQAMRRLPDDARMVLILRYYEQFSGEEIAQILNCNVGQAKMRVHRAKNALKDLLLPQLAQLDQWEGSEK
jgi:RNA polymerase sigma-70 factor (ECF subfamily)